MTENVRKLVGVVVSSGDDTDFSRNAGFRSSPGTFAGADRVKEADCCDQTLALLGSMQEQLTDISSQLQTHLNTDPQWSTEPASPEVQQIADLMAETCPDADPANWTEDKFARSGSKCVRSYLVGFPLELARQVVLTHGKLGFFHRFNFDLGDPNKTSYAWGSLDDVTTEEACEPIFYGNNPPPRLAIAVDTRDGVVLTNWSEFHLAKWTSYMQEIERWDLIPGGLAADKEEMHWPTEIETHGYC